MPRASGVSFSSTDVTDPPEPETQDDGGLGAVEPNRALEQLHLDGAALGIGSLVCHCRPCLTRS